MIRGCRLSGLSRMLLGIDETNRRSGLKSASRARLFRNEKIRNIERYNRRQIQVLRLDICYPSRVGQTGDRGTLGVARRASRRRGAPGYSIIIVSDRRIDRDKVAIRRCCAFCDPPALSGPWLAHQRRPGGRNRSAREVHHFALFGAYGAEAVHPYPPRDAARDECTLPAIQDGHQAIKNYVKAIGKGLRKVMSKMGISTYMSYTGAQIFEAVGLSRALIDKYFAGTTSNIEGIGVFEVAEEAIRIHAAAFGGDPVLAHALDAGGEYAYRIRGEEHMWTPDAIAKLQHAARHNSFASYQEYAQIINDQSQRHMTFRGLFESGAAVRPGDERWSRLGNRQAFLGAHVAGPISTEAHTTSQSR